MGLGLDVVGIAILKEPYYKPMAFWVCRQTEGMTHDTERTTQELLDRGETETITTERIITAAASAAVQHAAFGQRGGSPDHKCPPNSHAGCKNVAEGGRPCTEFRTN